MYPKVCVLEVQCLKCMHSLVFWKNASGMMANKQQILYPGEHAPWRFPPIQYPFDSMFASQYSRIRKDHVPRNAANAKSLGDSLWSSPEMSSKISPSSFLRFFFNWDWSDLLLFDADWLYCLEKPSFFAAAQLTFNRINPETALTCNFGPELHCSILWHGK